MRHLKKYNQFNDSINEEFFDVLWQSAKGAFKNFLTGLAAPFKSLKDDFKKGLKREELKKKLTTMLDSLLKTTSDSINKAEDESVINKIMDQFRKEFDEKCVEIDKEIKSVKESNSINEGALQDSMITGRVLLGMVRQKATEIKMEFDKKYATSKDLNGKKSSRISEIKAIVEDFKKKVTDDKYIDDLIKKYKKKLKKYRTCGLETGGEFSYENIVFKYLRRSGHIEKLYDLQTKVEDDNLTLKENLKK